MLLQTNSYIVPKDKRVEHARLLRRFRQILARIGCEHFEAYEQVGANWGNTERTGRYVQIMRFRDRKHQLAVQAAERVDPAAQQLIAEFCDLINFPYQQHQGLFAIGYYSSVLPVAAARAQIASREAYANAADDEEDAGGTYGGVGMGTAIGAAAGMGGAALAVEALDYDAPPAEEAEAAAGDAGYAPAYNDNAEDEPMDDPLAAEVISAQDVPFDASAQPANDEPTTQPEAAAADIEMLAAEEAGELEAFEQPEALAAELEEPESIPAEAELQETELPEAALGEGELPEVEAAGADLGEAELGEGELADDAEYAAGEGIDLSSLVLPELPAAEENPASDEMDLSSLELGEHAEAGEGELESLENFDEIEPLGERAVEAMGEAELVAEEADPAAAPLAEASWENELAAGDEPLALDELSALTEDHQPTPVGDADTTVTAEVPEARPAEDAEAWDKALVIGGGGGGGGGAPLAFDELAAPTEDHLPTPLADTAFTPEASATKAAAEGEPEPTALEEEPFGFDTGGPASLDAEADLAEEGLALPEEELAVDDGLAPLADEHFVPSEEASIPAQDNSATESPAVGEAPLAFEDELLELDADERPAANEEGATEAIATAEAEQPADALTPGDAPLAFEEDLLELDSDGPLPAGEAETESAGVAEIEQPTAGEQPAFDDELLEFADDEQPALAADAGPEAMSASAYDDGANATDGAIVSPELLGIEDELLPPALDEQAEPTTGEPPAGAVVGEDELAFAGAPANDALANATDREDDALAFADESVAVGAEDTHVGVWAEPRLEVGEGEVLPEEELDADAIAFAAFLREMRGAEAAEGDGEPLAESASPDVVESESAAPISSAETLAELEGEPLDAAEGELLFEDEPAPAGATAEAAPAYDFDLAELGLAPLEAPAAEQPANHSLGLDDEPLPLAEQPATTESDREGETEEGDNLEGLLEDLDFAGPESGPNGRAFNDNEIDQALDDALKGLDDSRPSSGGERYGR